MYLFVPEPHKMNGLYNNQEVLGKFEEIFQNDFDYDDIQDFMQDFLTQHEIQQLRYEITPEAKIRKLFFILSYHEKKIQDFLKYIKVQYDWLEENLRSALSNQDKRDLEIDIYRKALKDIPHNGELSVYRCDIVSKFLF